MQKAAAETPCLLYTDKAKYQAKIIKHEQRKAGRDLYRPKNQQQLINPLSYFCHFTQHSCHGLGACIYAGSKVHIPVCPTLRQQLLYKNDMDSPKALPAHFSRLPLSRNLEAKHAVNVTELASYGNAA